MCSGRKKNLYFKDFFLIIYENEKGFLIYIFVWAKHYFIRKHLHLPIFDIFHSQSTTLGKIKDKGFINPVLR